MKLSYLLLVTLPLLSHCFPATEEKSITLEDDPGVDSEHAETGGEVTIQKRSGSFDYIAHLKSGLLSSIGHASASIASGSSGSSSSHDGGGTYKSVEYSHHGNSVEYDPWSLKKSLLNTIFQAVKAITGGVTALKGQLIKGSGYVLSASGKVVAASGDKVTDVGKSIINSAQISPHSYGHTDVASVHPFTKFTSLSGASSAGSSGGTKHSVSPGPVVHTETITTYEIPPGHSNYGPPSSKPPTYSSATHQYLPPPGPSYSNGGGGQYSNGHTSSFEAPAPNYLPSGHEHYEAPNDDFNIYGQHKKLTDEEARKAAAQLQEILHLLPNGKTEFTASKTVTLDTSNAHTGPENINPEHVELQTYGLPNDIGPLESLSHTESITAAYRPQTNVHINENPSDIYRQMAQKQTAEDIYLQKHPNEAYEYRPPTPPENNDYKYNNYHTTNNKDNALQDLTPIIAALEVAKRRAPNSSSKITTQYSVEKNVHKIPRITHSQHTVGGGGGGGGGGVAGFVPSGNFKYLPPVVQKSKYTYFNPVEHKSDVNYRPVYTKTYAVRRPNRRLPSFRQTDYEITDPLLFNRLLTL